MSAVDSRTIKRVLGTGVAERAAVAATRVVDRAEREGLVDVAYATYDSPLGPGAIAATERGLVTVGLPNRALDEILEQLAGAISPRVLEAPARLDVARRELDEYFAGRRREFDLELDWRLITPGFYTRVLKATSRLPFGATSTYAKIASEAGNPRAYRAAGSALGHNPLPLVIPCHRILRAGGDVGNYAGGRSMKEFLLRHENALG